MIVQAFIRGALIIAIAALVSILLRYRSAALRHHIWATAVVVQLALLAFIPVLPQINLPLIPALSARIDAPFGIAETAETALTAQTANAPSLPVTKSQSPQSAGRDINWIFAIWLAGAGLIALRFLVGTFLMARIAYRGRRVEDGDWLVLAQRTARELGITRPITMIWGEKVSIPITWGVLYPMILLPASAREWPLERRCFVLVHEMAHVKRFDAFTQLLAQITTAIFWFSPFVWIAEWRMRIEREHACDDTVIRHGTAPTLYADELLQMVRSLVRRRAQQPAFAALAMARRSEFEGRMLAILDPDRPRRVTGITSGLVFALLSVLIAAPMAAVNPFAVRVITKPAQDAPSKPTPQSAIAASPECDFNAETISTHAHVGDQPTKIDVKLERPARCVFADITGPVSISPDERRIYAVESGGFARLREVTPERDVVLEIDRKNGELTRSFTINGATPLDDGATERAWLARVLPELLSEGAIDPQHRVLRLLKSNGLAGTLKQVATLQSPGARLAHFKALFKVNEWTAVEMSEIKAAAARSLRKSDLASFNRAVPKKESAHVAPKDAANDVEMMEQVLGGISSGYDLHMAMKSQLAVASREMLLMFTRQTARISSGHEAGNFLIAGLSHYLGRDSQLRNAWFDAVSKVSSYERRLVLVASLEYAQKSDAVTFAILKATADMSSSVDKTAVLTAVAQARLIKTPALRLAYLEQANSLTTSTDRRAVLEALQN